MTDYTTLDSELDRCADIILANRALHDEMRAHEVLRNAGFSLRFVVAFWDEIVLRAHELSGIPHAAYLTDSAMVSRSVH